MRPNSKVAIVGAGVMGCALASELARLGITVEVLERAQICSGSSGRNAGGVRHQFSSEVNVRIARRSIERIRSFEDEFGVDVGFKQVGYLFLASEERTEAALRSIVAAQRELGVPTEFISVDAIIELVLGIRADDLLGGSFCPLDGHLDPHSLVAGFAADARRHGARIRQGAEVVGLEVAGDRVTSLRLAGGESVCADAFVSCVGAWAGAFAGLYGEELPITPWRSQIFAISDTPDFGDRLPLTIDYDNQRTYFHTEGTGLVAGMDNETSSAPAWDVPLDWSKVNDLVERLAHRLPALEQASVSHGWAGFLELTPDENPIVGWTHFENLYTAAGFSGHGLSLGPGLAEEVAREVSGQRTTVVLDAYRPERFTSGASQAEHMAMR